MFADGFEDVEILDVSAGLAARGNSQIFKLKHVTSEMF
jgi:hypothetical protein